jgi:SAM-dependent methyltransferase
MPDFIAQNKRVYNAIASHFSSTRAWLWDDLRPFADFVHEGDRVLDVGCGNGRLYQLFADREIVYTGLDQSEALIAIAQKKFPSAHFVVGEMNSLPWDDNTFDVVFCIAAFHHLPDDASRLRALGDMKRVVKPGGTIAMLNWNILGEWGREKIANGKWKVESHESDVLVPWRDDTGQSLGERYYHGFGLADIAELAAATGLTVLESYYIKRGEKSTAEAGENMVTIFQK